MSPNEYRAFAFDSEQVIFAFVMFPVTVPFKFSILQESPAGCDFGKIEYAVPELIPLKEYCVAGAVRVRSFLPLFCRIRVPDEKPVIVPLTEKVEFARKKPKKNPAGLRISNEDFFVFRHPLNRKEDKRISKTVFFIGFRILDLHRF